MRKHWQRLSEKGEALSGQGIKDDERPCICASHQQGHRFSYPTAETTRRTGLLEEEEELFEVGRPTYESSNIGQVYQAVSDHYLQDLREFWTRSNFYILIEAGLFAAVTTSGLINGTGPGRSAHWHTLAIIVGALGFIFTLYWLAVARSSLEWCRIWGAEMRRIEKAVDPFRSNEHARAALGPYRLSPSTPNDIAAQLPWVALVGWGLWIFWVATH